MTVIYAAPVDTINPDDKMCRRCIAQNRLEMLDKRREQARAQGFTATLLLEYAVAKHYPSVAHPLRISVGDNGKPYLISEPAIQFSLSHSGNWAVCALSSEAVGVDIEQRQTGRRDIASRFFHREEIRYLNSLRPFSREDAFYSLWTLKESFVKTTGRGLDLPLRSFCIDIRRQPPTVYCPEIIGRYSLFLPSFPDNDYCLAVCVEGADRTEPPVYFLNSGNLL